MSESDCKIEVYLTGIALKCPYLKLCLSEAKYHGLNTVTCVQLLFLVLLVCFNQLSPGALHNVPFFCEPELSKSALPVGVFYGHVESAVDKPVMKENVGCILWNCLAAPPSCPGVGKGGSLLLVWFAE